MLKDTCSHSKNCVWRTASALYRLGSEVRAHHLCVAFTDAGEPCATRAATALGKDEDEYGMFYGVPLCRIHASGVISAVKETIVDADDRLRSGQKKRPQSNQTAKERWVEKHDTVYFARRGDDVKIGHSIQPDKRLRGLETQGGFKFDEIVLAPGGRALEQRYHRRFAKHRHEGEWFTMCDEIRVEMDSLKLATAA